MYYQLLMRWFMNVNLLYKIMDYFMYRNVRVCKQGYLKHSRLEREFMILSYYCVLLIFYEQGL